MPAPPSYTTAANPPNATVPPTTTPPSDASAAAGRPPTPLFLICRRLRQDTNLVFYGGNRFVVMDGPARHP